MTFEQDTRPDFAEQGLRITFDDVVTMVEATTDDAWQTDVVRSQDGSRNCFFGHLFAYAEKRAAEAGVTVTQVPEGLTSAEVVANRVWDWFEDEYATTYAVYPINDGRNLAYSQPTPRARVLAYLNALRDGTELTTPQQMQQDFDLHPKEMP